MANLTRWQPFNEMMTLRDAMDRLFEESFVRPFGRAGLTTWQGEGYSPAIDLVEQPDAFVLKAALPGMKPEDVQVTFDRGFLTLKGEHKAEDESKQGNWHIRERSYGSFQRTIQLPSTVNADRAEAHFENGVLTLTLPKTEEAKPKQIQVKAH